MIYMICTSCPVCFDGVTSMLMRSEWERIQAWAFFIVKAFSLRSSCTSQSLWSTNGRFNQLIRGCCVVVLWWGRKGKKSKVSQFWDNLMSCSFTRTTLVLIPSSFLLPLLPHNPSRESRSLSLFRPWHNGGMVFCHKTTCCVAVCEPSAASGQC